VVDLQGEDRGSNDTAPPPQELIYLFIIYTG